MPYFVFAVAVAFFVFKKKNKRDLKFGDIIRGVVGSTTKLYKIIAVPVVECAQNQHQAKPMNKT